MRSIVFAVAGGIFAFLFAGPSEAHMLFGDWLQHNSTNPIHRFISDSVLTIITDRTTGVRVGIPISVVGPAQTAKYGNEWKAADGRFNMGTLKFTDRTITALYNTLRGRRGRQLSRNVFSGDSFILEGTDQDQTFFYVAAIEQQGEIRGLSIVYENWARDELKGTVRDIVNSFEAFPAAAPTVPTSQNPPVNDRIAALERQLEDVRKRESLLKDQQEKERIRADQEKIRTEREKEQRDFEQKIRQEEQEKAKKDQLNLVSEINLLKSIISDRFNQTKSPGSGAPPVYGLPAGKKIAITIGVNSYTKLSSDFQLRTAVEDSASIADALATMGFAVTRLNDITRSDFNYKWQLFLRDIEEGGTVLFFFAGHGVQINHLNFLLPSDVPSPDIANEELLIEESIDFNKLRGDLQKRHPAVTLIILDACRDSPYKESKTRSLAATRGLARTDPAKGSFIMYSADDGEQALDRLPDDPPSEKNSVYTRTLIPLLLKGDLTMQALAQRIRMDVEGLAKKYRYSQTPAYYDGLTGSLCLTSQCANTALAGK